MLTVRHGKRPGVPGKAIEHIISAAKEAGLSLITPKKLLNWLKGKQPYDTRANGFIASPAGLVHAMNDEPDIIMQAVLAMPWDYARRIFGPAEVARWIVENHPADRRPRQLPARHNRRDN